VHADSTEINKQTKMFQRFNNNKFETTTTSNTTTTKRRKFKFELF